MLKSPKIQRKPIEKEFDFSKYDRFPYKQYAPKIRVNLIDPKTVLTNLLTTITSKEIRKKEQFAISTKGFISPLTRIIISSLEGLDFNTITKYKSELERIIKPYLTNMDKYESLNLEFERNSIDLKRVLEHFEGKDKIYALEYLLELYCKNAAQCDELGGHLDNLFMQSKFKKSDYLTVLKIFFQSTQTLGFFLAGEKLGLFANFCSNPLTTIDPEYRLSVFKKLILDIPEKQGVERIVQLYYDMRDDELEKDNSRKGLVKGLDKFYNEFRRIVAKVIYDYQKQRINELRKRKST
jgi:hypothetical protein